VIGDVLRVGGITESLPGDEAPRPAQRVALLAADVSLDAEPGNDVPGATRGEAEDGSGTVRGPGDGGAVVAEDGELIEEDILEVGVLKRGRSWKYGRIAKKADEIAIRGSNWSTK